MGAALYGGGFVMAMSASSKCVIRLCINIIAAIIYGEGNYVILESS